MARDFVEHLDTLPEGETGRVQFSITGDDPGNEPIAADASRALQGKIVLGLWAERGIPVRPDGPAVAVRVRLKDNDAHVDGRQ